MYLTHSPQTLYWAWIQPLAISTCKSQSLQLVLVHVHNFSHLQIIEQITIPTYVHTHITSCCLGGYTNNLQMSQVYTKST